MPILASRIVSMPHSIDELNSADCAGFSAALGHLFEHSPWVAAETWARRPFRDVLELHAELCRTMRSASPERQRALIRLHPDLAGRMARQRELTAASAREQAGAGLDKLTVAEEMEMQRLNEAYRTRFGFPFVICARLNNPGSILSALKSRLLNDRSAELDTALAEIEKIAWLRLHDTLTA